MSGAEECAVSRFGLNCAVRTTLRTGASTGRSLFCVPAGRFIARAQSMTVAIYMVVRALWLLCTLLARVCARFNARKTMANNTEALVRAALKA